VNSEGIGTVNVYGNDLYEIDVPAYGFKQKDISFNGLSMPKLFVSQDKVKSMNKSVATNRIDGFESKPSIDNAPLTDSYNLFYESGGWVLNDMINRQIQSTIKTLNQNPSFKLELKAHTDCQGDKAMNLQLSKARLAEAKKLFFSYGVSDAQIVGSYFGESLPANSCKCDDYSNSNCSGDELRLNRRTEVKILK
jgi:outer membrane protein OmpA-like peptidoglycan-associated protein